MMLAAKALIGAVGLVVFLLIVAFSLVWVAGLAALIAWIITAIFATAFLKTFLITLAVLVVLSIL